MLAQGLAMIICAFIFMTYIQGVVVLVFIVIISYILLQGYIYKKNEFYMPTAWIIVNSVLIFLGVIAPFIVQFFIENLLAFEGISVSIWILSFFIFLYAITTISADIRNIE